MQDFSHLYLGSPSLYDASSGMFVAQRDLRGPGGAINLASGSSYRGVEKVCHFEAFSKEGSPHLQAVDPHATRYGLTKMASQFPSAFLQKLSMIEPMADRVWAVGNALGAVETWGSNKNADAFPRMGLMNSDPDSYGHKTFEKHAYIYTHHDNKDPKKSIGKVAYAYWDDAMDKVLTLFYLLKDKAPHLVERLERGDSFPVSMGCRCDLDRCSIRGCENEAPTRAQYCEHLRDFPNQVLSDGQKVMALTPRPRFFDLSAVLRGADPIAHALMIVDPNNEAKTAYDKRPRYYPMYSRNEAGLLVPNQLSKQAQLSSVRVSYPIGVMETDGRKLAHLPDGTAYSAVDIYDASPTPSPYRRWRVTVQHGKLNYWFSKEEQAIGFASRWSKDHQDDPARRQLDRMQPVAKEAANKRATIKKEVPGMASVLSTGEHEDPRVESFAKESLPMVEATDDDIPKELLDILGESHGVGEILSSFAGAGIVLKPNEFRRLILVALGKKDLADQLETVSPAEEDRMLKGRQIKQRPTPDEEAEVVPSAEKVSKVVLRKIAHLIPGRSYLPTYLYQRALNILAPHVKVSFFEGLPPGTRIIIVPPQAGSQAEPKYVNRLSQMTVGATTRSSTLPKVPEMMSTLLLTRMLYNAYRTDPQAIINAFDHPVTVQDIMGHPKTSSDASMARAFKGIPTLTCVKYAHISPWRMALPVYQGEIKTSSFLLRELLAEPLGDMEKRATVVACEADDLVDAATVIGLRFAGGALRRALYQR